MLAKIHFFPVILKLLIELSRAQKFIFPSDSQITIKLLSIRKIMIHYGRVHYSRLRIKSIPQKSLQNKNASKHMAVLQVQPCEKLTTKI